MYLDNKYVGRIKIFVQYNSEWALNVPLLLAVSVQAAGKTDRIQRTTIYCLYFLFLGFLSFYNSHFYHVPRFE